MPAKIDIDALKILKNQEQMRLNIGKKNKKLKTVSPNSWFTGAKKAKCISACSLSKILEPKVTVKGGESSSQFQWFTIAKIEL